MNWSDTWTSRGSRMETSRTSGSPRLGPATCSQNLLRSVQKTCGLFDTESAGNTSVASQAVKPGTVGSGAMESFVAIATDEGSLGGIFQDLPMDLTEADYLDSFMDLSNFLVQDESVKVADDANVDGEEMKGNALGFSGIIPSLDTVSPADPVNESKPVTHTSPRKRKHAEAWEDVLDTNVSVSDLENIIEIQVSDHDYVSKKIKMEVEPIASTSKVWSEARPRTKEKYRERRDKNNVASKRSREIRKNKYVEMEKEADVLIVKNDSLRKKIVELEKLAKFMKTELIKKMTHK